MDDRVEDFDDFCKNTYSLMVNYCKSRGQKQEDAEEIVNDAYSRMWRAWDICADLETVKRKKWLYHTIDYIILEQNKKHIPNTKTIDEYVERLRLDVDDGISKAFENMKYEIYIKRARETLTESERQIFDAIVVKQQTYREAANEMGISEDAVRARMVRLRKRIDLNIDKILE